MPVASFWPHNHLNEPNALLHEGRLLTCFVVDIFASMDQQQLENISHNLNRFCLAWKMQTWLTPPTSTLTSGFFCLHYTLNWSEITDELPEG